MTQDGVRDAAFEMAASGIRFGVGVTREVGMDLADLGARLVLVLTDPLLAGLPPVRAVIESLEASRVPFALYGDVRTSRFWTRSRSHERVRSTPLSPSVVVRRSTPRKPSISTRRILRRSFSTM